jgi:SNF2 family DNA or RNA helicase
LPAPYKRHPTNLQPSAEISYNNSIELNGEIELILENRKLISPELKKLIAYELTQLHPQDSIEAASRMIGEARIDPNPHQIEAAIYGYKALQRGGAILADEVGLGKTIEAGLILNQYWAEGKRHILVVTPVALRSQWQRELESLFYLPSQVISTSEWKSITKTKRNPITRGEPGIFIVSDHLIVNNQKTFASNHWDLVVIDEAHRLRNVYRKKKDESVQAKRIRDTFATAPKLLLTATPFQNSLDELYGLISLIDQGYFGSFESFQRLYSKPSKKGVLDAASLRDRLNPIFRRTLRRDVSHYLRYTERKPVTVYHKYDAKSEEELLNNDIATLLTSDYLLLNNKTSRGFFDLIYLKLLGSSPYALNPALLKLLARFFQGLVKRGADNSATLQWAARVKELFSAFPNWQAHYSELARITCKSTDITPATIAAYLKEKESSEEDVLDEVALGEFEEEWESEEAPGPPKTTDLSALGNPGLLDQQIQIIVSNYFRTHHPHLTGRAKVFVETIRKHVKESSGKGFNQKAVVFTEYVRTLHYVLDLLKTSGFNDFEIIPYHGGVSNIKGPDGLSERDRALELFRNSEKAILISTEAGAEGLNLQFCNLLINYDLPWNPQRIEQRIGRCHRYGQKNDVIVINFVCEENTAERHIFKILSEKFKLFDGVFGASNSILGAIQSGVEVEKIFADIYLGIRSCEQVENDLESFLTTSETTRKDGVRDVAKKLLEEFDPDVTKILKVEWERLKEEVNLNLTLQEQKIADLVLSEVNGRFAEAKSLFQSTDAMFPVLSARQHTFQRVYASDDTPLITPRHSDVGELLKNWRTRSWSEPNSYKVNLSDDLKKGLGAIKGGGYWLYCVYWRIEGASLFEHIHCYLLEPNGTVIDSPLVRKIFDSNLLQREERVLHKDESDSLVQPAILATEDSLTEQREEISLQIYTDRITAKQKAKYDQEFAAEELRRERRQIASEFDLAVLKAPMKEKNRVMKERDAKLKELDKELRVYEETIAAIEEQEKSLHKDLTSKHDKGKIARQILFKVHLVFS